MWSWRCPGLAARMGRVAGLLTSVSIVDDRSSDWVLRNFPFFRISSKMISTFFFADIGLP